MKPDKGKPADEAPDGSTPAESKADAVAWRARWALMDGVHEREVSQLSYEQKLRQLDTLLVSARWFRWERSQADVEVVRERWIRLRRTYGL